MSLLKVLGSKIVDEDGKEVILRGAGLGGWMKYVVDHIIMDFITVLIRRCSMENFISGQPVWPYYTSFLRLTGFLATQGILAASTRFVRLLQTLSDRRNQNSSSTRYRKTPSLLQTAS